MKRRLGPVGAPAGSSPGRGTTRSGSLTPAPGPGSGRESQPPADPDPGLGSAGLASADVGQQRPPKDTVDVILQSRRHGARTATAGNTAG